MLITSLHLSFIYLYLSIFGIFLFFLSVYIYLSFMSKFTLKLFEVKVHTSKNKRYF